MTRDKLSELVFISLGRASMCWSELPKGTFDSSTAVELGEEILKAIDEYVEEDKQPGWSDPLLDHLDKEEKESEWQRMRRLDVMREAKKTELKTEHLPVSGPDFSKYVVSDTPDGGWMNQYYSDYLKLRDSGMMFEFNPTWTGQWGKDKYAFCWEQKNRKKQGEEAVKKIQEVTKEIEDREEEQLLERIVTKNDWVGMYANNPIYRLDGIYYTLDPGFKKILTREVHRGGHWWWDALEPK
jgi:hypothetical protein